MTEKEPSIIQGRYLEDILAQPTALEATLQQLAALPRQLFAIRERLAGGGLHRIVLTGMGSSFYSLTPLYLALTHYGYDVVHVETSELIHYLTALLHPGSLIVAVSQSGRSAEILRLLHLKATEATLVGITNTPHSPLAQAADAVLLTRAGDEFSVSSKTYVCTLAVAELLAAFLCHDDYQAVHQELMAAAPFAATYLEDWQQHVLELAPHLDGMDHLFFVGRGPSQAAAATGALITKESVAVHAEAMSSAAFRHGPMEILRENTLVAVLEGAPVTQELNRKLLRDISQTPGKAILLGYHAELAALRIASSPGRILPILEILPLEMITLAMGYLSSTEPGVFQRGTKITLTE